MKSQTSNEDPLRGEKGVSDYAAPTQYWAIIDQQLMLRNMNDAFAQLWGSTKSTLLNQAVQHLFGEEKSQQLQPYWTQALQGEVNSYPEYLEFGNEPLIHTFQATHFPIPDVMDGLPGFYLSLQDHSSQNKTINVLRKLHSITANHKLDITTKTQALLELGAETFGMQIAIISKISGNYYQIYDSFSEDSADQPIKPGDTFNLEDTYCALTLSSENPVAFHHVGTSDINNHPSYKNLGLESYIGTHIIVNNRRFGTLNFSSTFKRERPFDYNDYELIRLFAQWVGNSLSRENDLQKLGQQSQLLESMSEQARIGAWEVDLVNNHMYWSPMTRKIHEVDENYEPKLDEAINFYKPGYSRECIAKLVNRGMTSGKGWHQELQIITAKGRELWVDAMGQVEMTDGVPIRMYGSFQDVDARVKIQMELQAAKETAETASHSKGAFLANMSHEIRTPMNGVRGMLNLLSRSKLNGQQLHYLQLAQSSADSLLVLINDILDFSKIEAGKLDLEILEFDLIELLSDLTQTMAHRAEEKALELILNCFGATSVLVKGDPSRLRQILSNIISNAIKFTHQGHVLIETEISTLSENEVLFRCTVADTGIGIEKSKLNNLFEAFTQADTSTTREFGGTGLGLAIVFQLCQLMQGKISVNSQKGLGSQFCLTIPLMKADPTHLQLLAGEDKSILSPSHYQEDIELRHFANKYAWVIASHPLKRTILCDSLHQWMMQTTQFSNVNNPAEKLKTLVEEKEEKGLFHPCIIFLDSNLINTQDLEVCMGLGHLCQEQSIPLVLEVPFIMAGHFKGIFQQISEYCISKPVTPWQVREQLLTLHPNTTLPRKGTSSPSINGSLADASDEEAFDQNLRILLVEDNHINQEVAQEMLRDLGLDSDIANNGLEALTAMNKLEEHDAYDLILMDCQMPDMDGYETTKHIRSGEVGEEHQQVPIVALTANAMMGDRERCINAGMTDYITKPLSFDELKTTLGKYLSV